MKKTLLILIGSVTISFAWTYSYNCWISKKNSTDFLKMFNVSAYNNKQAVKEASKLAIKNGYSLKKYKISCFRMHK